MGQRPATERLRQIDIFLVGASAGPVDAEVPLAKDRRCIAPVPQEIGDGHSPRFDERLAISPQRLRLELSAPGGSPREKRIPARRADAGSRVRIGEQHPFGSEAVETGSSPGTAGVVAGEIASTEVVGEHVEDIRPGLLDRLCSEAGKSHEQTDEPEGKGCHGGERAGCGHGTWWGEGKRRTRQASSSRLTRCGSTPLSRSPAREWWRKCQWPGYP